MKKNYRYAVVIVLVSLLLWCSYFFYMQHHKVEYENGTFVELPKNNCEEWELLA